MDVFTSRALRCLGLTGIALLLVAVAPPSALIRAVAQGLDNGNGVHDIAPANNPDTGTLAGSANTEGGAATYTVPIVVPPGRAGMQPDLALTYNSRGGDGVMGMGWSISGLSSIHRCPQTPEQDGQTLGVSYSNSDRLCLDGERLVKVSSGNYGQPNTEYRTEIDSHARITQIGGDLESPSTSFKVEQKSGRILYYGTSANSRVVPAVPGGNNTKPLSWLVDKVQDRVGNDIRYAYHDYGDGEVLPLTVTYTGSSSGAGNRSVNFAYQPRTAISVVNDISSSYLSGKLTMQTQALQSLTTKVGNTMVRQIRSTYVSSAYNGRLLLQSLQECAYDASDSGCHPATQFGMNDGSPDYEPTSLAAFSGLIDSDTHQVQVIADLDGDGAREVTADVGAADRDHRLFLLQMTADRQVESAVDLTDTPFAFRPEFYMDVDGDGRAELIERSGASISFDVWSLPRGVPAASVANGTPTYNFDALFQNYSSNINITGGSPLGQDKTLFSDDIDGDGRTDIVVVQQSTACGSDSYGPKDGVFLYRNTTTRLLGPQGQPAATFANPMQQLFCLARTTHSSGGQMTYDEQRIDHIADFDGNGLPDFYLTLGGDDLDSSTPAGSFSGIELTQSAISTNFINPLQCDNSSGDECNGQKGYVTHWMDVNGDGLEDFVIARPNPGDNAPTGQPTWHVRLNTGGAFSSPEIDTGSGEGLVTDPTPGTMAEYAFRYANSLPTMDADGDGKADILVPSETAGDLHDGFALKICTIKRVQPLGTEGCPVGT
ncbi:MAG: SpvB/TcaC N-terminal domain-containing protein, partial [Rhodanobacteraceae bacterium]